MIYEWRIYEIVPGKRKALNERFAKNTIRLFEKHGMKVEASGRILWADLRIHYTTCWLSEI
jgi:hypothetical protein